MCFQRDPPGEEVLGTSRRTSRALLGDLTRECLRAAGPWKLGRSDYCRTVCAGQGEAPGYQGALERAFGCWRRPQLAAVCCSVASYQVRCNAHCNTREP